MVILNQINWLHDVQIGCVFSPEKVPVPFILKRIAFLLNCSLLNSNLHTSLVKCIPNIVYVLYAQIFFFLEFLSCSTLDA